MPTIKELVRARTLRPVLRSNLTVALVPENKAAEVARHYHGDRGKVYIGRRVYALPNGTELS